MKRLLNTDKLLIYRQSINSVTPHRRQAEAKAKLLKVHGEKRNARLTEANLGF